MAVWEPAGRGEGRAAEGLMCPATRNVVAASHRSRFDNGRPFLAWLGLVMVNQPALMVDLPSLTKRVAASATEIRSKASSSAMGRRTRWSNSVEPSGAGEG